MPWQCSGCAAEVADDLTRECPSCGAAKTAWTVVQNQTRTLRIGGAAKRFTCERAEDLVRRVAAEGAYADVAWSPTDWAPALPKAAVRDLAASGLSPAPADLVVVRQYPGAGAPTGVELTTLFEGRRAEGATFEAGPAAPFDARFLLVFGPEPLPPDVQFPDVTILDVTDDTPEGHAPALEVRALKKPAVPLDIRRRPEVVRALLAGLFFETDKAFLLPKAVRGLRQLRRYYDARPGLALLVVGHADTAGASEHNLVLSCERADAMAAFLRDDVERWTAYFSASQGVSKPWGTREVQWMLSALPSRELPFYEGEPTGVQDAQTSDAVERFQGWSNAKRGTALDVDGIAGPLTRRELVAAYMELDGTTFPAGATLLTHGCGEFHPEVPTGDGVASEENRRAEVFLFPDQVEPPPRAPCPAPGCPEYPEWRRKTILTLDLTLEPGSLEVLLRDEAEGTPLADADVQVAGIEGRAARTGPDGRARFDDLFPGPYDVRGAMLGYVARRTLVDVPPGTGGGGGGGGGGAQGGEHALVADEGAGDDAPAQAPPSREVDLPLEALAPALDLSRGLPEREVPVGEDPYAEAPFEPAASFSILHRDHARTLTLDDALPAPRDVLRLDASPSAAKDWTITARVPLRDGSERAVALKNDGRALKDGRFTSFLVCVYGGGGADDPGPKDVAEHPHVHAIDVSDPQPDGTEDVARTLHIDAFGLTKTVALHVRRPRVVKLVGRAVPPERPLYWKDTPLAAKESEPAARVVLHLGWRLRLDWTVLGPFDALVFTPSGRELARGAKDDPGQATVGSATLDLAVDAPGPRGLCPVEARRVACPSHLAEVQAVGITRFAMRSLQPEHPLARYDVATEKYARVDVLPGRAGTWKTFPETIPGLLVLSAAEDRFDRGDRRERTKAELDRQLQLDRVWFGTAERALYPWVSFEWTVVGPDDLQVELEVPRLAGEDPVSSHWDVGPATFAGGGQGGREVKTKFIPAARTAAFLQADLSVWEKGVKRDQHRRLTAAVLRTRIDRPMPAILDGARGFELRDGGKVVSDGARVSAWSNLELTWALGGDAVGNRLRLAVVRPFSASSDPIPVQDPLFELDLKEPGDVSSAATTLLGQLPPALASGGEVTLVMELMRRSNPDERERYKSPWVLSNGLQAARRFIAVDLVGSGRPGKFPCLISGEACPVNEALALKRKYDRALDELNALFARLRVSLNAAQFIRAAIDEATNAKDPVGEDDCAEALFKKGERGVKSAILGETQLYADIRDWEAQLRQAQKNAEFHAEMLIAFITSDARLHDHRTFQEHLAHEDHLGHSIDDDNVKEALALYGVTNHASVSLDEARRRIGNQTGHVLAVLTENLDATSAGQRFLRDFIVTAANEPGKFKTDYYAFDALFGYATKAYGLVSEPVGKLIFNSTSLLLSDLRRLSDDQINGILAARSFEAAGGDVLSKHFKKFLYTSLGKGLHGVEKERRVATAVDQAIDEVFIRCNGKEAYQEARQLVAEVAEEQRTLDRLRKLAGGEDLKKVDGVPCLWFSFFIDGVSMVLSLRKLEADMKKDATKASLSLLKDALGLVGGAMGLHEVSLINRQSVLVAGEASSAELAGVAARIRAIGVAKNVCSGVGGIASVVISAMEGYKAWKDRDLEKVLAHYAAGYAAACSVLGMFVPALAALGLWLGLAVWIYMTFFLDPPVVDWLEKTPWGVHPTMGVADVIDGFYGEFYDLSITTVTGHDSNHDAIEVQSDLLSEAATIRMAIGPQAHLVPAVKIDLSAKNVGGKGFIDWHPANTTIDGKRRFRLLRAWEVFPGLKRDGQTAYEVKVELEVDASNDRPELKQTETGVTFRRPPSPALQHVNGHLWGFAGLRRRGGAHKGDLEFLPVDPGSETHVFTVSTRYADGCKLEVVLEDESWLGARDDLTFTATIVDTTPDKTGEVRTKVDVKLWLPPEDDDIPFRAKVRIVDFAGVEVASGWTGVMRAARTSYLDA